MKVAAFDCGTNALRLLIADIDAHGRLTEIRRELRTVRLGEGVDATGQFSEAALARTFAVCDEYAQLVAQHDVSRQVFVATSASRDVSNRESFVTGVHARIGVVPQVIDGAVEARYSYVGATTALPGLLDPVLVVDIGGGSTEFVTATDAISVDVGCVRMSERHLHDDPPTASQCRAVEQDLVEAMAVVRDHLDLQRISTVVGVAGTVTTIAARALGLDFYDVHALHGAQVSSRDLLQSGSELLHMTRLERAALPYMHAGRVDVIGGGAMVLSAVLAATGASTLTISECDILDGIAYAAADATG
jgi:exopolyphosphatase/guanosine-5'-triphosphate,3'-diphosphate pyrophosphatase